MPCDKKEMTRWKCPSPYQYCYVMLGTGVPLCDIRDVFEDSVDTLKIQMSKTEKDLAFSDIAELLTTPGCPNF